MRLVPIAFVALAATVIAQGPPMGGGMPGMPPEMKKAFEAMEKWRKDHKNVTALEQTVRGLSAIQADARTKLSHAQAKGVLAVIVQYKSKPVLTDSQAKTVNQLLTRNLTVPQLKKIVAAGQRRGPSGPGGPGGPGGMGPGGPGGMGPGGPGGMPPGGPGGGMPRFKMPKMKDYNPLNPATLPMEPMRGFAQQNMDRLIASLRSTR